MEIKQITNQVRRDFTAVYECEHCGHQVSGCGYDDANFHQNVIPQMACGQCGQKSPASYVAKEPKHAANEVV